MLRRAAARHPFSLAFLTLLPDRILTSAPSAWRRPHKLAETGGFWWNAVFGMKKLSDYIVKLSLVWFAIAA